MEHFQILAQIVLKNHIFENFWAR